MNRFFLALILSATSLTAQSALIDRGGGLIYDDVLDITWLQNADYGRGSAYDDGVGPPADGKMTWASAVAWAEDLTYYDSVRGVNHSDWRLPTTQLPDETCESQLEVGGGYPAMGFGFGCSGGEMGHLFYMDGVSSDSPDLFTNVQSFFYWSGTSGVASYESHAAFYFGFLGGYQNLGSMSLDYHAWAVRDGDVAAVPIPTAVWFFGSALGFLGWMHRRVA